ncbi:MAG: hypothetical protein OXF86_13435 [Caldilineaceae bacterium]|nr:hypothetical protein [Caldilineaceae bacterium]
MFNINDLLTGLAESRQLFHSEADFQHALAWHIHQDKPERNIRLEYPLSAEDQQMYADIYLPDEKIAIELKYATRSLEPENEEESFALRDQGAQNLRRYDFLRDIRRLELMRSMPEFCEVGLAVFLTNDSAYWNGQWRLDATDAAFRVHEGREISPGELNWVPDPKSGTKKGREESIEIEGCYCLRWQDYSDIPEKSRGKRKPRGKFRYLAVSVK